MARDATELASQITAVSVRFAKYGHNSQSGPPSLEDALQELPPKLPPIRGMTDCLLNDLPGATSTLDPAPFKGSNPDNCTESDVDEWLVSPIEITTSGLPVLGPQDPASSVKFIVFASLGVCVECGLQSIPPLVTTVCPHSIHLAPVFGPGALAASPRIGRRARLS